MIKVSVNKGGDALVKYLKANKEINLKNLDKYGKEGVAALSSHTPVDSGLTASSWSYQITNKNNVIELSFSNSNIVNNIPIAIILQYGHATNNGGYVTGIDYINPALAKLFKSMADAIWEEVKK